MKSIKYPIIFSAILTILLFSCIGKKKLQSETIHVDEKGIFFFKSGNLHSTFKEFGYYVACERLWQSEILRRTSQGNLAEFFGDKFVESDIFMRTISYSSEEYSEGFNSLDEQSKTIYNAYVEGFNKRINEVAADPSLLPFEFHMISKKLKRQIVPEKWTVTDPLSISIYLMRQWDPEAMRTGQIQNAQLLTELSTKFPELGLTMFNDLRWQNDPLASTVIPSENSKYANLEKQNANSHQIQQSIDEKNVIASNSMVNTKASIDNMLKEINGYVKLGSFAWAVSGDKTTSGNPILYSAPQMGFSVPCIGMEVSLDCPEYTCSGFAVPGIPIIIIGRTKNHAWSFQVGHSHGVDNYTEDPKDLTLFKTDTIHIAGKKDSIINIYRTKHGPIVYPQPYTPGKDDKLFSWKYANWMHEIKGVTQVFKMGKAKTLDEFREAASKMPCSLHICYADKKGNIAYLMSGNDPVRPVGVDTRFPQLGDGSQEWLMDKTKSVSFDANSSKGYYAGWNNKTNSNYDNANVHCVLYNGSCHRAQEIINFFESKDKFTFDEIKDFVQYIQLTNSTALFGGNTWNFIKNDFIGIVNKNPTPQRKKALEILNNWNGIIVEGEKPNWTIDTTYSDAYVLQDRWVMEILRLTFADELNTNTMTWKDHHPALLFNCFIHALKKDKGGVTNKYNWFNDSKNNIDYNANDIIIMALDNVLDTLGEAPWNVSRERLVFEHKMIGKVADMPWINGAPFNQLVEIGSDGPVRIESLLPLGQSGDIRLDTATMKPVFDEHFFSFNDNFKNFQFYSFPLFK